MDIDSRANNDVSFFVKRLENHIQRYAHSLYDRKEFQECSLMNMYVVDFLSNQAGRDVFQKDVEAEFFINRATASKMLTLMEEKMLIRRQSSDTDGRMKRIILEPKGMRLHKLCLTIRREIERAVTADLTPEETRCFKSLCAKMIGSME